MRVFFALALSLWVFASHSMSAEVTADIATHAVSPSRNTFVPPGFVTTVGRDFVLDGKPFNWFGANSYWLPLLTTTEDVEQTFKSMKTAGIKVVRTWVFNAINATELSDAKASGLTYYQVWDNGKWTLNDGPQGLLRLDHVIKTAEKYDIKVILAFTNNWFGYGGLYLYLSWIQGSNSVHGDFYTNPKVIASYQAYVRTIIERYKQSSAIFAWELVNEARCGGDRFPTGTTCTTETLGNWYRSQSDFVRRLDRNHLITTGAEGFFAKKNPPTFLLNGTIQEDANYNGSMGDDFDNVLSLPNIDFGTYHGYPQSWNSVRDFPGSNYSDKTWTLQWIQDHADSAKKANKPVIFEEFGVGTLDEKADLYPPWIQRALDTRHGIMNWQWGQLGLTESCGNRLIKYTDAIVDGASPNDGNTVYPNQTQVSSLITRAARIQNTRKSWLI